MPFVRSSGADLYVEDTGSGYPIVFVHEFGADVRAWEAQVRWFSRDYRCLAFNARGYPPSSVPSEPGDYGYVHAAEDIRAVLRHFDLPRAHVVGLSMGGYATLQFALRHPEMASALVVAACGSGTPPAGRTEFKAGAEALAAVFLTEGSEAAARIVGHGDTRTQLLRKDPRGWQEFMRHLGEHSPQGSALTLQHYQAARPSLYEFEAELKNCQVPTLLAVGDEDEPCIEANLFLKRVMPAAQLWMVPATGHAINLEEPAWFNDVVQRFFSSVERAGRREQA